MVWLNESICIFCLFTSFRFSRLEPLFFSIIFVYKQHHDRKEILRCPNPQTHFLNIHFGMLDICWADIFCIWRRISFGGSQTVVPMCRYKDCFCVVVLWGRLLRVDRLQTARNVGFALWQRRVHSKTRDQFYKHKQKNQKRNIIFKSGSVTCSY